VNVHRCPSVSHLIPVRFSRGLNFLDRFSKNPQLSNFVKTLFVGVDRRTDGRTNGRTNMTKFVFAFRSVANTPKMATSWSVMQFSLFGGHQRSEGKPRHTRRGRHNTVSAVRSNNGALW
jgi:hypothetical protein